jgi:hypothetical protein
VGLRSQVPGLHEYAGGGGHETAFWRVKLTTLRTYGKTVIVWGSCSSLVSPSKRAAVCER